MKEITLNFENLVKIGLTLRQALLLYFIHTKDRDATLTYVNRCEKFSLLDFEYLKRLGLVEFLYENNYMITDAEKERKSKILESYNTTSRYTEILSPTQTKKEIKTDWINEWYDLWPRGVKSGGHYVRSSMSACERKMKAFLKNTEFEKETIMDATKAYIQDRAQQQYSYMQLSHYFIYKDGVSALETWCDNLKEGSVTVNDISSEDV